MQLRVARLCLDCEELHTGESCPVCASERYAFLSRWLPSEERRRWRRPAPTAARFTQQHFDALKVWFAHTFGDGDYDEAKPSLRTRESDSTPRLDFDEPEKETVKPAARSTEPLKHDR